jgi:tetratricopeptide (TPR) repeat protein
LSLIARVHIRRGDGQTAQDVIDKIIADFNDLPGLPQAVFRVGEEYWNEAFRFEKEELKEGAKESFRKATGVWERIITQLRPSSFTAQAYYFSGTAYGHMAEYEKAIEYYEKAVADWPDYEYAWLSLLRVARTYDHLKRSGAIPAAEADGKIRFTYERILQEYPKSAAAIDARRSLGHR